MQDVPWCDKTVSFIEQWNMNDSFKVFFFYCRDKKTFMTLSYSLAVKLPLPFEQQTYSTTENHAAALSLLKMADSGGMFFFCFFFAFQGTRRREGN